MTSGAFSIDDAFDSEDDDKIRLYGSTKETAPLRVGPKIRPTVSITRDVYVTSSYQ